MQVRRRRYPNERVVVLAGFGLATGVCVGLELFREHHYGAFDFRFLLWNLFLAWIPLLLALAVYDGYRRGVPPAVLAPGALLWLLFLPNAPYLVTDFVHLAPLGPPLWFDGLLISAFAWTGMILGFVSLYLMHAIVRHRYGAGAGWAAAVVVLGLTSVGVYIGRFLQWNSWDLLVRPGSRLAQIAPRLGEPTVVAHALAVTVLLTALLATTYLAFYALVGFRADPGRSRRPHDR
jgi:uncharacterized membrane protein